MRLNPASSPACETYPFVRLDRGASGALLARRRRPDRLRHRRAARGDAGVHPRRAVAGAIEPRLDLPAAPRACPSCARRSPAGSRAASARRSTRTPRSLPTLGSKEAIFHLAQVLGGDLVAVPAPAYPVVRARRGVRGQGGARAAAARRERLPARPRRRRRRRPGRASAILWLNYPNNPTARDRPARASTSAPPRSRASTTSCSPPTRPTRRSTSARAARVGAAGGRPHERRGVQHALQALLDARLPLGLRGRRPGADRRAQALPAQRRRRAAGVHPARRGRRVGRRGARRGGARALPRQARRAAARARRRRPAPRGRRRHVLPVARRRARAPTRWPRGCSRRASSSPRARSSARRARATCGSRSCPTPRGLRAGRPSGSTRC